MRNIFVWLVITVFCLTFFKFSFARADSEGYTFENETQRALSLTSGCGGDDQDVQMQVVGNQVYYIYSQCVGSYWQIFTAYSNLDGTGYFATQ